MAEPRRFILDGREVEADPQLTLIQACDIHGVEIPRFCYHERLSIAGNCRMCLVEPVGAPKPAASCHMQVRDLRGGPNGELPEVRTNSPMVKKAREGVMEFLLINHPLDCPICDQGGECDLQDQAMAYGIDFSRYREPKRAVEEPYMGPLIKTHMTRCIACTRCVRFITEVGGIEELGLTGRGEDNEIVSYLNAALTSEMQGNVVDLCPVGALTNRPYAFTARPWELRKTPSIDVMDALGSSIRVDVRGRQVLRILPRNHDGTNEEWISDKTRHVVDGLRRQRLDRPYIRRDGKLKPASWPEAFAAVAEQVGAADGAVAALAGDLPSVEAMWSLKSLMQKLGSDRFESRTDGAKLPAGNRSGYVGTARVEDIDRARAILVVGSNPRTETPVLNARIRKAWLHGAEIGVVGQPVELTYPALHLGTGPAALTGESADRIAGYMGKADNPLLIVGQGALTRPDGAAVLGRAMELAGEVGAKLLVLHTAAARVGGLDIGFAHEGGIEAALDGARVIFNLGADEIDLPEGAFVVYQGHHGDRGAHRADVILPGATYTEQSGIYVNTEGRVQMANRAHFPPGEAREDWAILRALSAELGATLPWNSLDELRADLFQAHPHLARIDAIEQAEWRPVPTGDMQDAEFGLAVRDHYMTNAICRASELMAELSRMAAQRPQKIAAE